MKVVRPRRPHKPQDLGSIPDSPPPSGSAKAGSGHQRWATSARPHHAQKGRLGVQQNTDPPNRRTSPITPIHWAAPPCQDHFLVQSRRRDPRPQMQSWICRKIGPLVNQNQSILLLTNSRNPENPRAPAPRTIRIPSTNLIQFR
jgi:hypothetical protein